MLSPIHSMRTALALASLIALAAPAAGDEAPVAYTNAAIETAGKAGRIENGTLLVRGGKIEAVGTAVKIPDGARVIDARGKTIMPGIIDPFREINIAGVAADAGPQTIVIRGRAIALGGRGGAGGGPFTRVADNFYPYETGYRILLRSGLTGLNLVTAGYGQSAVARVTPAQPEAMLLNPDGFLFTTVTNDSNSLDVLRTALESAEKVKKGMSVTLPAATPPPAPAAPAPPAGRGRGGRGRGGRAPGGMGGFSPGLTPAMLKLWVAVYEGKAPLFVNTANAAAIVHLLKVVEPYKDVRLVLTAPGQALHESLDHLTKRPLRVIVRPGLSLKPNTRDRVAVANLLHEAGVDFAFAQPNQNDLLATQDSPLFPIAYLVRSGLPRQAALEALTARPAAWLGLDRTHGSLEPDKSADLLLFVGDPLDLGSQLTQVLIEGRTVYEN